jgi:DNA modification methylase
MTSHRIIQGDCIEGLRTLPDASVHCCVTSPPYWGLRDYGHDGQIGLEATPEAYVARMVEVFREVRRVLRDDGTLWLNLGDTYANTPVGKFNGGGFTDISAQTGGRDLSGVATSGGVNK